MNGFRIRMLQESSYILFAKSLQRETHVPTTTFIKCCLSNFLNSSRNKKNAHKKKVNLSSVSHNLEPIFTTWMALSKITTFSSRLPTYLFPFKTNTEIMYLTSLEPFIELLNANPTFTNKCLKTLGNIQAGDFGFVYTDNIVIDSDKVYYNNDTSKTISTLRENQSPKIYRTIEQVSMDDDLSTCKESAAKNVNSPSPMKSELKTRENQQQQSRDSFETLQQLNTMKTQGYTKSAAKPSASSKIETPLKIPLKWSFVERSHPRREYYTWKSSKIENNAIKCHDHRFFVSDIRRMRQESADRGSFRFNHLACFKSSGNQRSQKSMSVLPSVVPPRTFASKSCTIIQQSIREMKILKKVLSTSTSVIHLKSTRSHPVSLAKLRSFSCDASKKSADCEKDDKLQRSKRKNEDYDANSQTVARSGCRSENEDICVNLRRKNVCASSQDDAREKRQRRRKSNNKLSNDYVCPELKQRKPVCKWDKERCHEDHQKYDTNRRISSRDRAQQLKEDREQFCEKRKKRCRTEVKKELEKKRVKGPAKCISRKKPIFKCQSAQKDKDKKSYESTKRSNREESFCINRKKKFMKNETESVKRPAPPRPVRKDEKARRKEQIEREYKELNECKKGTKKERKDNKAKMISIEHKPTDLNRILSSYEEQQKKKYSEKLTRKPNNSIISTDAVFKWLNIQSRITNGKTPIVAKNVSLFNVMFDRSFSTAELNYQDDFITERTMNDDEMPQNYSANSDDFIHGDELPNVEVEYDEEEEEEEDNVSDSATNRSTFGMN